MNFYPHHISDFNNSTRHLTRVERSVYRDAIELYYDTESVLIDDICRLSKKLICRSEEEKQALNDILDEFFEKHEDGYFHNRCDHEISKYRANISAKAKAGIASAAARKQKAADRKQNSTRVKSSSTNQEPRTKNQEPRTNLKEGVDDKPSPRPVSKKTQLKTYLKNCEENDFDPIPDDSIVFRNADTLQLPYDFVLVAWEHFKNHWLSKSAAKVDWVATFNNCLKADGYGAYQRNSQSQWYLTTKGKNTQILINSGQNQ